jgi:hypothetical protein
MDERVVAEIYLARNGFHQQREVALGAGRTKCINDRVRQREVGQVPRKDWI